jgi:hypothetical protein
MQTTMRPSSQSQTPMTDPPIFSLGTQASFVRDQSQPLCIVINNNASNQPTGPQMHLHRRTPSGARSIADNHENKLPCNLTSNLSPAVDFSSPEAASPPPNPRQENCSALVWYLFSHVKHLRLNKKAEVANWYCPHIGVGNLWKLNPVSLMNTARTKLCHLCAA